MREIVLPFIAFVSTVILIAVLRPIASKIGLVDKPNVRKLHSDATPVVGGIAIYLGILLTSVTHWLVTDTKPWLAFEYMAFYIGGLLILIVGVVDDRRGLSSGTRLAMQTVAVLIMALGGGVYLHDLGAILPGGYVLQLGWLAIPFTVFACVGVINAINMSDGMDGLSGNLILVTLLGLGIANSLWGGPFGLKWINVFSGAVAGFLVFNQRILGRKKAWVFMGDAGSMMLGFFLAWSAIVISQGDEPVMSPAAALWLFMVPVNDTVAIMLRRLSAGKSPMRADAEHLHHLLMRLGFTVGEVIAAICLLAGVGVVISIGGTAFGISEFMLVFSFLIYGTIYTFVLDRAWKARSLFGRSFIDEE